MFSNPFHMAQSSHNGAVSGTGHQQPGCGSFRCDQQQRHGELPVRMGMVDHGESWKKLIMGTMQVTNGKGPMPFKIVNMRSQVDHGHDENY